LAEDVLRRCDLLIALGDAQRRAAHPDHRQTLLTAAAVARKAGDGERLAAAALTNTRMIAPATQVDPERVAVLTEALEAIGDQDSPVRAKLLGNLAGELFSGEWDQRVELSEQAVAMARRLADPATLAQVIVPALRTLRHPSTLAQHCLDLIAELAARLGNADAAFSAAWYGVPAALEAGDMVLAQRHLADATHLADDLAQPALRWVVAIPKITLTVLAGRLEEGEWLARQVLAEGNRNNHPDSRVYFAGQLLAIGVVQGRLSHLETLVTECAVQYSVQWVWQAILARVYCALGRVDDARRALATLAASDFAQLPQDVTWLTGMVLGRSRFGCPVRCVVNSTSPTFLPH
jgi:hypothetical protein